MPLGKVSGLIASKKRKESSRSRAPFLVVKFN